MSRPTDPIAKFGEAVWPLDFLRRAKPADQFVADLKKQGETRVVNETTGGAKGSKPSQLAWAPPHAMLVLGEVYGYGAEKYDAHNYRRGYAWSLSLNALLRHYWLFVGGEDNDAESGLPHMAHCAWHALNLIQQMQDHPELDDRYNDETE